MNFKKHFPFSFVLQIMSGRQSGKEVVDNEMIREMRDQLALLQQRRRELECRRIQEEEEALRRPILPHLTEMMRYGRTNVE